MTTHITPTIPATSPFPVLPGTGTLGVLGGGQLGRMFVHAAQTMGYRTVVLDPDASSPAGQISHGHLRADYLDSDALMQMGDMCDAITTEFENVPAAALAALSARCPVAPASGAVAISQDRAREKTHFTQCGVACAPYAVIETDEQARAVDAALLPGILKTARLGYDGKGQARVDTRAELMAAWEGLQRVPCVLEQMLAVDFECSILLARGRDGTLVHYPPQRNVHHRGILTVTEACAGCMTPAVAQQIIEAGAQIANGLDYVGVLCIEFFVLQNAEVVVNEIAPRPHNSGHYTLDACNVSQFEMQVRSLAGLPLIPPRQHSPAVMLNLLGDIWPHVRSPQTAPPLCTPAWDRVLEIPGARLHLYGKQGAREGRKMGHLTLTASTMEVVRGNARQAATILGIETGTWK